MTSKTFESIDQTRQLHVMPLDKHVTLVINYKDAGRSGLTISHSDAPALALAILEAAGYVANSADAGVQPGESCDDHFWDAAEILRAGIAIQAETEAKDKAELEAEALELFNTQVRALGDGLEVDSLDDMHHIAKESWLAVARRAREMRTEK